MNRHRTPRRLARTAALIVAVTFATTFVDGSRAAPSDDARVCPSSADAYDLRLQALTGPRGADVTVSVDAISGCALPDAIKKVQLKTFAADGSLERTRNLFDVDAQAGVTRGLDLGDVPRDRRIEADILVEARTSNRTYVLRGSTRTLLRPDLVVENVVVPQQTLVGKPVVARAVIRERNGDVGADAFVSLSAIPGRPSRSSSRRPGVSP
jgi:hypothetical protein